MANIADCAVAIEKDEEKLREMGITRTPDDYFYRYAYRYKTIDGDTVRITEVRSADGINEYYEINGEPVEFKPERKDIVLGTYAELELVEVSNKWRVDCLKAQLIPYETDMAINEYDDHITLFFGGRWGFPQELEDKLNALGLKWQGAEAEGGNDILNDELGNEYYNLEAVREKEEDDTFNYYVEDTSKNILNW